MVQRPKSYKSDPIIEAVFGIRFESARRVAEALPAIQDRLAGALDFRGTDTWWIDVTPKLQEDCVQVEANASFRHRALSTSDGKWLLTIGENFVSAHVLKPYPTWKHVRPRMVELLNVCLGEFRATRVVELMVRYVDEFVPPAGISAGSLLHGVPEFPLRTDGQLVSFACELRQLHTNRNLRSLLRFGQRQQQSTNAGHIVFLDLAVSRLGGQNDLNLQNWADHVDELHDFQKEIFESTITPALRTLLQPVY